MRYVTQVFIVEEPDPYGDSDADSWHVDVVYDRTERASHSKPTRRTRVFSSRYPKPVESVARSLAKNSRSGKWASAVPVKRITVRRRK